MLMMSSTGGTFSQVVDATVRGLYDQGKLDLSVNVYGPSLGFTTYEPDVPSDQLSTISGPGYGILTIEGQQYGSNELYKGYPVTLVLKKFTSELAWTEEDIHWIQKQPSSKRATTFNSVVKHAINALNGNLNLEACKVFYLGHGTSNLTGGDSLSLFNTSHTIRKDGSTQANNFGSGDTHRAFSADNLVLAVNNMNRFKGMNGVQMLPVRRIRVVVAGEKQPIVEQALNSLYGPLNANLGLSTASQEAFRARSVDIASVVAWDTPVAYKEYWSVIDLDRASELAWLASAWMPRMAEVTEAESGIFKNESSTLFGYLFSGWQWAFGSKGDGSAIA